ncbi:peptidoglycan-binding protein [Streptomyces humidus]|uniref:Peptidoglycan-binding protein n=1 Tax=Streptomyces humidus TaxID=52259 RepID=A0A918L479_9ACTN|nr:peptidoglycan-binding domain-containing protein [Streptomyces humidus]GGR97511.1 peptidoglycan-binding protein [Streptomyces humidus]
MSQPPRGACPLCGAHRAADGAPACVCARLASDAHRSDRTAQAAAAEDFDPVRIRPFVVLEDDGDPQDGAHLDAHPDARPESPADPGPAPAPATSPAPGEPPYARDADGPVESDGPGESGGADDAGDTEEDGGSEGPDAPDAAHPGRRLGRVRLLVLTGVLGTAVTAAVLVALFVSGGPARDGSLSEGVRAPVPDVTSEDVTTAGRPSAQVSPTQPSPTASRSTGPSASASASPSRSAEPSPTASAGATGTAPPDPGPTGTEPPVLRLGDTGPEVTELQARLSQIGYYTGAVDGVYSRQVAAAVGTYQFTRVILQDESGVYGAATRASLEAETDEP